MNINLSTTPGTHKCTPRKQGSKVIFYCELCGMDVREYDPETGKFKPLPGLDENPHLHTGVSVDVIIGMGTTEN